MSNQYQQEEELFLQFQKEWDLTRVEKMTLEEYTNISVNQPTRNDFTYWLESKLGNIGSIWGGSSFKFGIYRRDNLEEKSNTNTHCYSNQYAWLKKYGKTQEEAFLKIKSLLIDTIKASQMNNLEIIDNIDLGEAFKWKVAFHYQNINDIHIVDIFQKETIDKIASLKFNNKKLKTSEVHKKLLQNRQYSLQEMIEKIGIPLWTQYGKSMLDLFLQEYLKKIFKNKNTQRSYQSHMKTIEKKYSLKLEDCKIPEIFLEIKTNLEKDPEFVTFNRENNNAYSNALKHYYNFLLNYASNDMNQYENNNLPKTQETKDKGVEYKKSLNQILYGPPGTGKTYHTIDRTLEILGEYSTNQNREKRKQIFNQYKEQGQIEFITFHQSYGYEEFVEGIKPITKNGNITYEVQDGIFKKICKMAQKNLEESHKTKEEIQQTKNMGNTLKNFFNHLIETNQEIKKTKGGFFTIQEIDDEKVYLESQDTKYSLQFKIQEFEKIINSKETFNSSQEMAQKVFGQQTYQSQIRTYMFNLYQEFEKFKQANPPQATNQQIENKLKPYILIIDEINRGNVSKIFGELITLIEPSKRIGADEELRVTLPYSQELFGVPKNLYIIGTMNTADRSITALDTALRRRFEFVEMMPDATKLGELEVNDKEINLKSMLEAINQRIEFLLDREKTIGHAYFLGIDSLDKLKEVFQNKIIPLLQEYFYNDYEAIQAVLNDNGMVKIKMDSNKQKELRAFKDFINDRGLDEKKVFEIASKEHFNNNGKNLWDDPQTYIIIYER